MTTDVEPTPGPASVGQPPAERPPTAPRLTRSRRDRWLGGVAGGLAEYAGIDPVLVRLLFVLAAFLTGGTMLLVYLVAWIIVPEVNDDKAGPSFAGGGGKTAPLLFGLVLVALGGWALLRSLGLPVLPPSLTLPLLLIGAGIAIIVASRGGIHRGPGSS